MHKSQISKSTEEFQSNLSAKPDRLATIRKQVETDETKWMMLKKSHNI